MLFLYCVFFRYYNGNDQTEDWQVHTEYHGQPGQTLFISVRHPVALFNQVRGFGHVGFLVADLDAACAFLESEGVAFKKKPAEGNMRGLAFAYDPDGYWVEIIQRGGISMLDA